MSRAAVNRRTGFADNLDRYIHQSAEVTAGANHNPVPIRRAVAGVLDGREIAGDVLYGLLGGQRRCHDQQRQGQATCFSGW